MACLLEIREDVLGGCMIGHDPEGEEKCEEAKHVQEQNDALCQR